MQKKYIIIMLCLLTLNAWAQADMSYYLPEQVSYNPDIPTPKSILGYEVGEYHVSHDKLVQYMYALDKASDRITLEVTGYTHEARPLLLLTITSLENHKNIESIRKQHLQLTDANTSSALNTQNMPAVFYLGCSIHGNEASGANAGLLMAYHLAAAQGDEIENALKNTIVLFDPSFNPDGLHRFSSWVNSRKSKVTSVDPYDTEHNEPWPGGRTNHYWFDLNRDWLVAQHPESQARIKKFHEWKPNVLTDHHEMGTNSTFFFQPGVPSRMHPLTPEKNHVLTKRMGEFHAKALDEIGSLYYTQENYDDFYYGKGSTFPDIQGAIGILFEQASSRGHAQESVNGILTFPFTIRNQFTTMLSSLKAVNAMREDLLNYQRDFYKSAASEAGKDAVKAIIFGSKDKGKVFHLAEILTRQDVKLYKPSSSQSFNGVVYDTASSYVIPLNQKQYKLIKSSFEMRTSFTDSLFYDISTWTLPLAAGLDYNELRSMPSLGKEVSKVSLKEGKLIGEKAEYAYVFEAHPYYGARATYRLLNHGIRVKVANEVFYHANGKKFERGSILIPLNGQQKSAEEIEFVVREILEHDGIDVYGFNSGLDYKGVSLGSESFQVLKKPEIAMLIDDRVSPTDAGELWHVMDTRFQIPVTLMTVQVFNTANLDRYNTIILPPGAYTSVTESAKEKLKSWVKNGGVIVGFEQALTWLNTNGLAKFEMRKQETTLQSRTYSDLDETRGAQETSGAILEATADLSHPLLYGYSNNQMPVFKSNNLYMEPSSKGVANPVVFTSSPLISGYISKQNYNLAKGASVAGVSSLGKGRVIGFTENLAFRGFWFGSNKMLMNAIFFGAFIQESSAR